MGNNKTIVGLCPFNREIQQFLGDCLKVYCLPDTSHSYQVVSEGLFLIVESPVASDFAILQEVVQQGSSAQILTHMKSTQLRSNKF